MSQLAASSPPLNSAALAAHMRSLDYVQGVSQSDGIVQIGVDHGNRRLAQVITEAAQVDFQIEDVAIAKPSLDDVFLKYTGHTLRDQVRVL